MMRVWMVRRFMQLANLFAVALCLFMMGALFHKANEFRRGSDLMTMNQESGKKDVRIMPKPEASENLQMFLSAGPEIKNSVELTLLGLANFNDRAMAMVKWNGVERLIRPGETYEGWSIESMDNKGVTLKNSAGRVQLFSYSNAGGKEGPISDGAPLSSPSTLVKNTSIRNLFNHWGEMMRQVRVMPYVEKGRSIGYVILYIQPDSFIQKMGFKIGDIIRKVNGEEITSLGSLLQIYQNDTVEQMIFDIRRGVEEIQLVCQEKEISEWHGGEDRETV